MVHDAARTKQYIDDALQRFSSEKDPVERNLKAFAYVRGRRRRGDEPLLKQLGIKSVPDEPAAPLDVNLADAEHYMYARYLASSTGDPSVKALVSGYEIKKLLDSARGTEQQMRTNPRFPVLPPSVEAVRWGLKGTDDGLRQYKDAHGGKIGRIGDALKVNQDFILGQYKPAQRFVSRSTTY
ncbi:MAG TPA: hypothetical protein VGX94_00715 [Terriglobia bacterium]|nr:hypothetical protein [Terriglobia bacterium]